MSLIGVVLNINSTGDNVAELHNQLANIGAPVDEGENTSKTFGATTQAAIEAFQKQHDLPVNGSLDQATARLMHLASAFAGPGGREALAAAVEQLGAAADGSPPEEIYWRARSAILVGNYPLAQSLAAQLPDFSDLTVEIAPMLAMAERQPRFPEIPYPENFYSYRRDLYPLDSLKDVQRQVIAVGEPPRDPRQAGGFILGPDASRGEALIRAAASWFEAIKQWQIGNDELDHRRYAAAQAACDASQAAACDYFSTFYTIELGNGAISERLTNLIKHLAANSQDWAALWSSVTSRRALLTLDELAAWDFPQQPSKPSNLYIPRVAPPEPGGTVPDPPDFGLGFIQHYLRRFLSADPVSADPARTIRQQVLEAPLITIAFVLAPLARAEANRARRQFDAAIRDLRWVLDSVVIFESPQPPPIPPLQFTARLACEFIELPFARLLLAETLLDKADAEYKARIAADPPPAFDVTEFQGLKAAQTYLALKEEFSHAEPRYVERVDAGRNQLAQQIQVHLTAGDTSSREFQLLGKGINVPTLAPLGRALPGLGRRVNPHDQLLTFTPPQGQSTMRESNPRVYAVLLAAQARLEQLRAGFNYLGYPDDHVPPFRFQFLLDRARYFAEHAKNAQREYLNFLSNAEREDFQELSASQNVEMEKSNLRIETARMEQASAEVAAADQSRILADLSAEDARRRLKAFKDFDEFADNLFGTREQDSPFAVGIAAGLNKLPGLNIILTGVGDFFSSGAVSNRRQTELANAQRGLEKFNLRLAEVEAGQAVNVAKAQLKAAIDGLAVAGLQRQAALLRHEFAVQNLQFLRNRTLDAEQWYRLAASIRSVSETYLRYAIELAFLTEQAYEFEADKRINVIRFDYDLSEVGNFLAADFLLRDLDTLEQDLIVTQRQREQHVRYVLSMAREFPEALQEIRDNGFATFSLRLEQLEGRFPGLYNLRIGAVDVLPVALMDSTRFSLELTHLGVSQVRLKEQPDTLPGTPSTSPLNTNDLPVAAGGWLADQQEAYPVKLRVTGPETAVFSGLARQEASAIFAFATTGQRQAFESLGATAAWKVDFNARENQIVPGSLADLLITFTLSGYHDPELRRAIDAMARATTAATQFLSGSTIFPDAYFEFNRTGTMTWNVKRDLLTLTDTLGAVRNVAVVLVPAPRSANSFGRMMSHCEVQVRITADGRPIVLTDIPQLTFSADSAANPLSITAQATLPSGTVEVSWDFGDGSARQFGSSQQHVYSRPGRYTVTVQTVRNGRLSQVTAHIVVSRIAAGRLSPPVMAIPKLVRGTGSAGQPGHMRMVGTVDSLDNDPVIATWRIDGQSAQKGNRATFDLLPGDYTVSFTAVRQLRGRISSTQRQFTTSALSFNGLNLSTNRRFEIDGTETTGTGGNPPSNNLTQHLFSSGALSPVDQWMLELPLADNPFLRSVGATDVEQVDLSEIQDAILVLEYLTTPGGLRG